VAPAGEPFGLSRDAPNRVPASREMDGDMLLVGVETQAVWLWGVRDGDGNPLVWERYNEPGAEWAQTQERLDEFLWHFTLVEVAVVGGRYGLGANDVSPAGLARFTSASTALPVKPWRWPGPDQTLWTWGGLLAWTMVNDRPDSPSPTPAPTRSSAAPARTRISSMLTMPVSRGTRTRATNCKCQPSHDQPRGGQ
jgi:hypothetical protein